MSGSRSTKFGIRLALRVLCIFLCGVAVVACVSAIGATFAQLGSLVSDFPLF